MTPQVLNHFRLCALSQVREVQNRATLPGLIRVHNGRKVCPRQFAVQEYEAEADVRVGGDAGSRLGRKRLDAATRLSPQSPFSNQSRPQTRLQSNCILPEKIIQPPIHELASTHNDSCFHDLNLCLLALFTINLMRVRDECQGAIRANAFTFFRCSS